MESKPLVTLMRDYNESYRDTERETQLNIIRRTELADNLGCSPDDTCLMCPTRFLIIIPTSQHAYIYIMIILAPSHKIHNYRKEL